MKLKGKKAIITGGNRGLGKATAIAFAQLGVDVAITGRNEKKLKSTVLELQALGVNAFYEVFDVANYKDVKVGIKNIISNLGTVDILVNNAGVMALRDLPTVDGYDVQMQTNVISQFLITKELFPLLRKSKNARIVNHTSMARLGGPLLSDYFEKKGGENGNGFEHHIFSSG